MCTVCQAKLNEYKILSYYLLILYLLPFKLFPFHTFFNMLEKAVSAAQPFALTSLFKFFFFTIPGLPQSCSFTFLFTELVNDTGMRNSFTSFFMLFRTKYFAKFKKARYFFPWFFTRILILFLVFILMLEHPLL